MPNLSFLIFQLRPTTFDSNATRFYDALSGGFIWSDERPADFDLKASDYAFRYLIGYRSSLIRQQPRAELLEVWEGVLAECPQWPGFRLERCNPGLRDELDRHSADLSRTFNILDRLFQREQKRRGQA